MNDRYANGLGDNSLSVIAARSGFSVCCKGKRLLSNIDPIKQAQRIVLANCPLKSRTLYLCPSPLFGYGLETVLDMLPDDSAVLCVEAETALSAWTEKNFDAALTKTGKIRLVLTENPAKLIEFVDAAWGKRHFRRIIMLKLSAGWQLLPDIYEKMFDALQKNIAITWSNALTMTHLGRLYAKNAVRNLPLLANARNAGEIDFSGYNVLAAGAGPSLDSTLDFLSPQLKKGRNCLVICADTALSALLEREIVPDLVVALEAQHWNLNDFTGLAGCNVPIAMDLSCLPATAEVLGSETFIFWTEWASLRFLQRLTASGLMPLRLEALGSVALSAVSLALKLNAKSVLCAGIDFSFTIDKYHCRGSPPHRAALEKASRLKSFYPQAAFREGVQTCLSKSGFEVRTDPAMKNYQRIFQNEFSSNNKVFDIEGSGLDLGVKTLTLSEAGEWVKNGKAAQNIFSAKRAGEASGNKNETAQKFASGEIERLCEIVNILQGNQAPEKLGELIKDADYLWAHFPDYAGLSCPGTDDIAFLKRVRAEAQPFIKLFETALPKMRNPNRQ
ncbi:MAG: DUF115 domain-containing protein [Spirochaetaceae bacterium]|jgi:hypothetical protein|nr:DUF115 domain-containing protein [Spirochaetaceae bacterium]